MICILKFLYKDNPILCYISHHHGFYCLFKLVTDKNSSKIVFEDKKLSQKRRRREKHNKW